VSKVPEVLAADFIMELRPGFDPPPPGAPEIAIAGRSNVGKSTLLNRLAGRRSLARTSKTPGRTRGILFYDLKLRVGEVVQELRLVDLPGYGYAQVSHAERKSWQPMVEGYVKGRATLALFLTLVDARRALGAEEEQMIEWLASLGVRHRIVVTKADKLSARERSAAQESVRAALPPGSPPPLLVSGETGFGVEELWGVAQAAAAKVRSALVD
jgi:GTP-binding protein